MKFIEKLLRKLYYAVKEKPLTDEELSQRLIEKIRAGGGVVGENVDIIGSRIDMGEPYLISIGDNVTITGVNILTHDASTKKCLGYSKVGKVTIGSDVFIGNGVIILPDTRIGNKVIVGAGSVVAKDIPDNVVVAGNPIGVICTYDEYMEKNKEKMKRFPVINLYPNQIMDNEQSKRNLIKKGFGYML